MGLVRSTGVLLPITMVFASFAALLHTFGPLNAPYTWLRPLEFIFQVFHRPHVVAAMAVAYALGRLARPGAAESVRRTLVRNEPVRPRPRTVVAVAAACLVVLVLDGWLFPAHQPGDDIALVMLIVAGSVTQPRGRVLFRKAAHGAAEALVTAACLVLVSYTFTIVKANLFHFHGAHDDQLIAAETMVFGEPLHRIAAGWGRAHEDAVVMLDALYFRLFDHILVVSAFLIGLGDNRTRHRYFASLCICYLVGGVAYYVVPSEGPAFAEQALYAFLRGLPLQANRGQHMLAENAAHVRGGTLTEIATYCFVAAMPSLHIAHESIMLFYARASRPFFALSLVFTLGTAAAVLVLGFHYALDALAGFALGSFALFVANRAPVQWYPGFCDNVPAVPPPSV